MIPRNFPGGAITFGNRQSLVTDGLSALSLQRVCVFVAVQHTYLYISI